MGPANPPRVHEHGRRSPPPSTTSLPRMWPHEPVSDSAIDPQLLGLGMAPQFSPPSPAAVGYAGRSPTAGWAECLSGYVGPQHVPPAVPSALPSMYRYAAQFSLPPVAPRGELDLVADRARIASGLAATDSPAPAPVLQVQPLSIHDASSKQWRQTMKSRKMSSASDVPQGSPSGGALAATTGQPPGSVNAAGGVESSSTGGASPASPRSPPSPASMFKVVPLDRVPVWRACDRCIANKKRCPHKTAVLMPRRSETDAAPIPIVNYPFQAPYTKRAAPGTAVKKPTMSRADRKRRAEETAGAFQLQLLTTPGAPTPVARIRQVEKKEVEVSETRAAPDMVLGKRKRSRRSSGVPNRKKRAVEDEEEDEPEEESEMEDIIILKPRVWGSTVPPSVETTYEVTTAALAKKRRRKPVKKFISRRVYRKPKQSSAPNPLEPAAESAGQLSTVEVDDSDWVDDTFVPESEPESADRNNLQYLPDSVNNHFDDPSEHAAFDTSPAAPEAILDDNEDEASENIPKPVPVTLPSTIPKNRSTTGRWRRHTGPQHPHPHLSDEKLARYVPAERLAVINRWKDLEKKNGRWSGPKVYTPLTFVPPERTGLGLVVVRNYGASGQLGVGVGRAGLVEVKIEPEDDGWGNIFAQGAERERGMGREGGRQGSPEL